MPARPTPRPFLPALAAGVLLAAGCGGGPRAEIASAVLDAKLAQAAAGNRELLTTLQRRVVTSLEADLAAGRRPSIDLLVLSGGADWGAYGTGFLRAWAERPAGDPQAMPEFDRPRPGRPACHRSCRAG